MAKKTSDALEEFWKRNMVSEQTRYKVRTPDHMKIFKPEEQIETEKLIEALNNG